MSIEYASCYSSSKLIERLEELQQEGYIFRGQSDARWPITPNAFREDSLKNFQKDFPAGSDCWRWSGSDEAHTKVSSHFGKRIQELPQGYALQHQRLSKYIIYLMQYNYSITKYYHNAISHRKIKEPQLPKDVRDLLKYRPSTYWAEKKTFIAALGHILL